ncbi:MAG: exodeoxyribonuclease VII small subunit [Epulopiscium sp. Nele67-Bin001]|nr:MAG: exodeoxyribonuclease VII small subunit [Epulopiscium sp. Nuni2H_MBin001]OON92717.1 MAG: exodeoxyribonuclease VII small subunit [Epulopiscium sp. Nele67-Bin001]
MDFETSMMELEKIVNELEQGSPTLENIVATYKRGLDLACACSNMLHEAQQEVHIYEDGKMQPFKGGK